MKHYDICIVGAGAAGLAAAVTALTENPNLNLALLDGNDRMGRKLYATGNGHCNLTNMEADDVNHVLDFFGRLGLSTVADEAGRVYPASMEAADVAACFEAALDRLGADFLGNSEVSAIEPGEEGFVLTTSKGKLTADKVLLATGGKAGPMYGTTGQGYGLAKSLGHSVTATFPVLTGIEAVHVPKNGNEASDEKANAANPALAQDPAGKRARAKVTLVRDGKVLFEEDGQVQFTKYGLSGIVIFNASAFVRLTDEYSFEDYEIHLDLAPQSRREDLIYQVSMRAQQGLHPLQTLIPRALAETLVPREMTKDGGFVTTMTAADMVEELKDACFRVTGVRGWKMAQTTGGGVPLSEVDEQTLESAICPGLYLAGELLEPVYPCGGFNLHHAWQTGMTAGRAMACGTN